jgi:predicted permease
MQVTTMVIFLAVWLLIFWLGSIFLEATGMDRSKARFQALSAMSGTGFTTRESESVVNHPKRRKIVAWLIFIGNAGIIAFIMFMILYLRAGLEAPSRLHVGIILVSILIFVLVMKFVDKPTGAIVRLMSRRRAASYLPTEELLYQAGEYGVARVRVSEKAKVTGSALKQTRFSELGIMILAIERGHDVLPFPELEETVLAGDCLLCYGKITKISNMTQ